MADFKPCPFCGGQDIGYYGDICDGYGVACECGANSGLSEGMRGTYEITAKERAFRAWNTRPAPEAFDVERVREAFSELIELQKSALNLDMRANGIRAPEDARVKALCEEIGYGAVMDSAARQWHLKQHGSGHTTYHCWTVVKQVTERAKKALSLLPAPSKEKEGG